MFYFCTSGFQMFLGSIEAEHWTKMGQNLVGNWMFKVNNRYTRKSCEICSQLTIKTPKRRQWCQLRRSGVFIVLFWTYFTPWSNVSFVNFEQINASRELSGKSFINYNSEQIYIHKSNSFLPNVIFWSPRKVQKTKCLHMISGGVCWKGIIGNTLNNALLAILITLIRLFSVLVVT